MLTKLNVNSRNFFGFVIAISDSLIGSIEFELIFFVRENVYVLYNIMITFDPISDPNCFHYLISD